MKPRELATKISAHLRVEFDRMFADDVAKLEVNDQDAVRAWVLDHVARAMWNASQPKRESKA